MSLHERSMICERSHMQQSLSLDGELSEIERRMLVAHMERCPDCAAYGDDVGNFTRRLREAPYVSLSRPVTISRARRAAAFGRLQVGVAASLAIAALGLGSQLARTPAST